MKILLTILSAIMVLFAGGCTLMMLGSGGGGAMFLGGGGLALIPGGVLALNLAMLAALWGKARPGKWVFVTLAILDAIVVAIVLLTWSSFGLGDPSLNWLAGLTAFGFAVKGVLSAIFVGRQ
ncbi:MAG: hypothetical protein KDK89_18875 [Alphaproteobacteria bacterium]|nr:hypothetical protein [Alphaproteobacteria bacterium]